MSGSQLGSPGAGSFSRFGGSGISYGSTGAGVHHLGGVGGVAGVNGRHAAGLGAVGAGVAGGALAHAGYGRGAFAHNPGGNAAARGLANGNYANHWPGGNVYGFKWNRYGYGYGNYWRRFPGYWGWAGAVFWPYAYNDLYFDAFWGLGYYDPFWDYGYDDIYAGLFSPYGYDDLAGYPPAYGPVGGPAIRGVVGNGNDIRVVRRGDTGQTSGSGPAPQQMVQLCGDDSKEVAGWPIERIQQLVMPTGEQQTALDELATASIKAAEMIKTACPAAPTFTAPGRLEAMEARIEAMQHAIEIVREPMDRFYGLLTDEQKARLVAGQPAANQPPAGGGSLSQNCAAAKSATQWPAAQIERAVRPTGDQLAKLDALKAAARAGGRAACLLPGGTGIDAAGPARRDVGAPRRHAAVRPGCPRRARRVLRDTERRAEGAVRRARPHARGAPELSETHAGSGRRPLFRCARSLRF